MVSGEKEEEVQSFRFQVESFMASRRDAGDGVGYTGPPNELGGYYQNDPTGRIYPPLSRGGFWGRTTTWGRPYGTLGFVIQGFLPACNRARLG